MKISDNWLFIYKGNYQDEVAGVAGRYLSVGKKLLDRGCDVSYICNQEFSRDGLDFVAHRNIFKVIKKIIESDRIVLQGGGPFLLIVLAIASLFGKVITLDAYAPHWLELYCSGKKMTFFLRVKIIMNIYRLLFGGYFYSHVVVGNERQLDLIRGVFVSVGCLNLLEKVEIVTGGCETEVPELVIHHDLVKLKTEYDVVFAWIGGLWDWFSIDPVLESFREASGQCEGKSICLVFFGVSSEKKKEILSMVETNHSVEINVFCFGWVPFDQRLAVWRFADAAVVWSDGGLENDYASRTRNFDCITLGLPVIQNYDDFWGKQIIESNSGIVCDEKSLSSAFLTIAKDESGRKEMSLNIGRMADKYSWGKIAQDYVNLGKGVNMTLRGFFGAMFLLPALLSITISMFFVRK